MRRRNPTTRWIVGFGWNQEFWPDKRFPTAADLDAVVSDRPVVLERVDGHAIVVNSAAMKAAGVTAATQAPAGGAGSTNGLFVDDARRPGRTRDTGADCRRNRTRRWPKHRTCCWRSASPAVGSMSTSARRLAAFQRAGDAGTLQVRLMSYMPATEPHDGDHAARRGWLYGDHLRLVGVKLFADGALGSRGAWLKQPYADKPDTRGLQFHSRCRNAEPWPTPRPRAGSRSRPTPSATPPMRRSSRPTSSCDSKYRRRPPLADRAFPDRRSRRHPAARARRDHRLDAADPPDQRPADGRKAARARTGSTGAYAWQSVLKSGATLAFGTDFPVESPNPFPGLAAAISRQDMNGQPPGGWIPGERLTLRAGA